MQIRSRLPRPARAPGLVAIVVAVSLISVGGPTGPAPLRAQEPDTEAVLDSLRAEIERLKAQIDSLRTAIERGEPGAEEAEEDALAELRAAAEAAAAAGDREGEEESEAEGFVGRQRSLQALNPEISVTGDVFSFYDPDLPDRNNFVPREFEFSFQSALDPYSRAKVYLAHHEPGGGLEAFHGAGGGDPHAGEAPAATVEEAYVEWVSLPGGLGISLGRFRQRLGTYNRWHRHALPWQQLPLPYLAFVGEEGLAQSGASLHWLLPVGGDAGTYEVWLQGTRSENDALFGESSEPSLLGHVNAFWSLSASTYLELGASAISGRFESDAVPGELSSSLVHLEAAFNWRPPRRALYRELTLRGALLLKDRERTPAEISSGIAGEAMGAFVHGEYRLGRQWLAGLRYDYVENPDLPEEDAWAVVPTVTWWQSEWVRLRAEYDHVERPDGDAFRQLLLQVTFAMGPHKHETY